MPLSVPSALRSGRVHSAAALAALAAAGVLLALPGTDAATSRPVTGDEATRLALSRLTTYEAGPAIVDITVPTGDAVTRIHGLVDFRIRRAVGTYTTDGVGAPGMLAWDQGGVGVAPARRPATPTAAGLARAAEETTPPDWSPRAYTTDLLDTALRLTMAVAADRPDNAQLLAQSGARWLRDEDLAGHRYGVFSGPVPRTASTGDSHLTYWVDADGDLRRLQLRAPGTDRPITVELTARHVDARVPQAPWGTGTP
ncbi:hypothetical protein ATKI12_6574 [Kitasatospora sp. Ki12]